MTMDELQKAGGDKTEHKPFVFDRKKILILLGIVFVFAAITRVFIFDSFFVRGDSMAPAILDGDFIIVSKLAYLFAGPKRGDIIVATPRLTAQKVVKRIIGLPGERIEILDGRVVVKQERAEPGEPLFESYLEFPDTPTLGKAVFVLDPKEYFIMGDRRYSSIDSRLLGPVDEWDIEGRVIYALNFKNLIFRSF